MKRILSLFLAFIMLFSALLLVSCGKSNDDKKSNNTEKETETEDKIQKFIETYNPETTAESYIEDDTATKYDFEGHEFKFLNSAPVYYMYIYLDPDMTGDTLDDCAYERNFIVEQEMNISITEETQSFNALASYAKTLILSGEDVYDAMYIPQAQLTPLISENLFYDLLEIKELHTDRIWWDQPMITRNTIEDRLFFATSDLSLMAFEGIWCMYFNEDMMIELGLDLPFQLALDGKWTFDELKKYCSAAANLNGDTSFVFNVNGNATYGLSNASTALAMAYGMGTEFVSRDENGRYKFTADTDPKFTDTWTKLINFFGPDDGLTVRGTVTDLDPDGYYGIFESNRALFLHAELKGATMLREWEGKFGLMPQPKYDESQEVYNSNLFNDCLAFCIPNTNKNLSRTGIIVDYLTYKSYQSLLPRYYDIHVSLKALGRQESIDVLALIRGTRGIEASWPYRWASDLNSALSGLVSKNSVAVASAVEANRDACIAAIEKTYAEYPTLNRVEQ